MFARGHKAILNRTYGATNGAPASSSVDRTTARRFQIGAVVLVVVLAVTAGLMAWNRQNNLSGQNHAKAKIAAAGPAVETVEVTQAPGQDILTLEGQSRPFFEATIYAKVSGYLKSILVYEGAKVRKGDILAIITSPETDQAFVAARADAANKKRVAERYRILLQKQLASAQESEQAFADFKVAQARLTSAEQMRDYETLRAPFDGVVTARFVDPGTLIPNASNSLSNQLALMTVADLSKLKIDAYVDQAHAAQVKVGQAVQIFLPDQSDQKSAGVVSRISGSLDNKTRMLFVEVDFDNAEGKIVSGSFVNVQLTIDRPSLVMVPVQALVTQDGKPALAEILPNHHLKFQPIEISANDGTNLMISRGISKGQIVALNVGSELRDGDPVQPPKTSAAKKPDSENALARERETKASQSQQADKPVDVPAQDSAK